MPTPATSPDFKVELDPTTLARSCWPEQARRFESLLEDEGKLACPELLVAARRQVLSSGKRLRAILPLLVARALSPSLDGARADAALWAGVALEIAHAATLVHDDVIDEDRVRRNEPTVWVVHGVPQAINAGDLLFSLAPEALHRTKLPGGALVEALRGQARALRNVSHGQARETALRRDGELPSLEAWHSIARAKTGALFSHGLMLGGLAAGSSPALLATLDDIGERLGVLFQLQDDLLDLLGDKGRSVPACDVWEGKPSWLVAVTASRLDEAERRRFAEVLYRARANKTPADVAWLLGRFEEHAVAEEGLGRLLETYREFSAYVRREVPSLSVAVRSLVQKIHTPLAHRLPLDETDS